LTENKFKRLNGSLLLPIGMLVMEGIVFLVLLATGYEISPLLRNFLLILGAFLVYQIGRQILILINMSKAVSQIDEGDQLVESGQPMRAIKLWKDSLIKLPRQQYQAVLSKLEATYQQENMRHAVQQVKAIRSESDALFSIANEAKRLTAKDRNDWQARSLKIRDMIQALPVEKGQSLSEAISEEKLD